MKTSVRLINLFSLTLLILCTSCATPKMWSIKKTNTGGVIGAQNYKGVSQEKFNKDFKAHSACPNSYIITGIETKSQTYQSSMILKNPDRVSSINHNYNIYGQNNSSYSGNIYSNNRNIANYRGSSYGSSYGNVSGTSTIREDGGYSVVPYTQVVYWNEIPYRCADINLCLSGNSSECIILADRARQDGDNLKAYHLLTKICHERSDEFSSISCLAMGSEYIMKHGDVNSALKHFKRGCELNKNYQKGNKQFQSSMESCAFYGAHAKDRFYYDLGTKYLTEQCIVGTSPEDCYNLLCAQSLNGDIESALTSLRRAVKLGYKDVKHLLADPDLKNIRDRKEFHTVIEELKKNNRTIYSR